MCHTHTHKILFAHLYQPPTPIPNDDNNNNNNDNNNNDQYGFVNYALELLVLKHFGLDVWEQIK